MKTFTRIGKHLYRYRAAIAVIFFIPLAYLARPQISLIAHFLILIGVVLRIWAAGYIGPAARKHEFHAEHQIVNGPYRFLRHPLYAGNFFLVLGVLILYNPPRWFGLLYVFLFIVMYTLITLSERQYLEKKIKQKGQYKLGNLRGELSTLIVLGVIYLIFFLLRQIA